MVSEKQKLVDIEDRILLESYRLDGNIKSMHSLVENNKNYIYSIANNYKTSKKFREDIEQEAICGFIHALNKYDLSYNTPICFYASYSIKSFISKYLKTQHNKYPLDNTTPKEYYIDEYLILEGILLNRALSKLSSKEIDIIIAREKERPTPFKDLGAQYNCSRQEISRIHQLAMKRIRVEINQPEIQRDRYKYSKVIRDKITQLYNMNMNPEDIDNKLNLSKEFTTRYMYDCRAREKANG